MDILLLPRFFALADSPIPDPREAEGKKSRFILLHNSLAKYLWDRLLLIATLYIAVSVPYEVAFIHGDVIYATLGVEIAVEILFVLDIILNFRTTYVNSQTGRVVCDARSICVHYVKTWFLIDLLAALPLDLLLTFKYSMVSVIHLLKPLRLLRLLHLQKLEHYSQNSSLVLTFLMSIFALMAHWMACIWFQIGQNDLNSEQWQVGWLYALGERLETPYINRTSGGPSKTSSYLGAFYFTLCSMTTVGFGNISPNTYSEKIFSICVMVIGALMHALIFSNVTTIVQRLYARHSAYHTRMNELNNFIQVHCIPPELKQRMLETAQTIWSVNSSVNAMDDIPVDVRADINIHLYREILELPLFKDCGRGLLRALSLHLKSSFCVPGDYLINHDDVVHAFHLVCAGSFEVIRNNRLYAKLDRGSLIGSDLPEAQQVIKANASVKAVKYCSLQSLSVEGLREVLRLYPEWASLFTPNIHSNLTYNLRQDRHDQENHCSQ